MKNFALVFSFLMAFSGTVYASENLISNSDFDLGVSSYSIVKILSEKRNPEQKYEAAYIESDASDPEAHVLRVPNRFAETVRIFAREFILEANKTYTLSFRAKAEKDKSLLNASITSFNNKDWGPAEKHERNFTLKKEWTDFSMQFKTPEKLPGSKYFSLRFSFADETNTQAGDLWLDKIQVIEGEPKDYKAPSGIELASAFLEQVITIPETGKTVSVSTWIANHSDKALQTELILNLVEDFSGNLPEDVYGKSMEAARISLDIPPHQNREIKSDIRLNKYGSFLLIPELKNLESTAINKFPGRTSVIAPYEGRKLDLSKDFCVAVNFAGRGWIPKEFCDGYFARQDGIWSGYFGADETMKLYKQMGVRLFRDWDYGWPVMRIKDVESAEGVFDFSRADATINAALANGIQVMPVLGSTDFEMVKGKSKLPEWLRAKSQIIENSGSMKHSVEIPPLEVWRAYVRAVAEHFKGRIKFYEIINEPNLYLSPEIYVKLLKAAQEEIRAADSSAKIVGFCITGDMGVDMSDFTEECCKLGALNYIDILSFHPYEAPHLGSPNPADRKIAELRAKIARYMPAGITLWNSELYYLKGTGDGMSREATQPQDLAQRFLTDLGEGIGQSTSICAGALFRNPSIPRASQSPYGKSYSCPNNFTIYNSLARIFEGSKPFAKIKWDADCICYIYERDGRPTAAFWRYGQIPAEIQFKSSESSKLQLYDLYGNKIAFPEQTLGLDSKPFYLAPKENSGLSTAEFTELMRKIEIKMPAPLKIEDARLLYSPEAVKCILTVRNLSVNETASGMISVQGKGLKSTAMELFSIAPDSTLVIEDIKVRLDAPVPAEITASVKLGNKNWDSKTVLNSAVQYCSVGTQESSAIPLLVNGRDASHHKASFKASYDEQFLYIKTDVEDSTPSGEANGRHYWHQDCVEIFLDTRPANKASFNSYRNEVLRIFALPYSQAGGFVDVWEADASKTLSSGLKSSFSYRQNGYSVVLSIPLKALNLNLPLKGQRIGFDIAVDDADGTSCPQLLWSSSGDAYMNRLSFGIISFK